MYTETEAAQRVDLMDLARRLGKTLRRFWPLVIVLGLLGGGLRYVRAYRSFSPYYESHAVFTVSSGYSDDIFTSSYYNNAAAQQLAAAFPYMLNTDIMRDLMKQELGKEYINGSITASSAANTNLFLLKVRSSCAQDAYDVLRAAITCFPQAAVYMVDNPQIIVREEPQLPTAPANAFSGRQPVIRGAVEGIILSMGILALLAMMTKTVETEEQLKALANLPVLAVLPALQTKKRRSGTQPLMEVGTNHRMAEAMRGMTLKVRKKMEGRANKAMLVTSTLMGEGKTTVAANLAMSLAADGSKVALIDADLRKQSIAQRFGNAPGRYNLIDCLRNPQLQVKDCLTWVEEGRLAYLSGASASSRRYSIDGKSMRRILEGLNKEFDYVVMDSSPCALVADTVLLSHYAGCVLYVVKQDCVRESQIVDMVNELCQRDAKLEGFIFNGVKGHGSRYGYGYGYKYGYGYSQRGRHSRYSTGE